MGLSLLLNGIFVTFINGMIIILPICWTVGVILLFSKKYKPLAPFFLLIPLLSTMGAWAGGYLFSFGSLRMGHDMDDDFYFWFCLFGIISGSVGGLLAAVLGANYWGKRLVKSKPY